MGQSLPRCLQITVCCSKQSFYLLSYSSMDDFTLFLSNLANIFVFRLMSCKEWEMMIFFHGVHVFFRSWSVLAHFNDAISLWVVFLPPILSSFVHCHCLSSYTFFKNYCWQTLSSHPTLMERKLKLLSIFLSKHGSSEHIKQ